jgi:hypothetical protein
MTLFNKARTAGIAAIALIAIGAATAPTNAVTIKLHNGLFGHGPGQLQRPQDDPKKCTAGLDLEQTTIYWERTLNYVDVKKTKTKHVYLVSGYTDQNQRQQFVWDSCVRAGVAG